MSLIEWGKPAPWFHAATLSNPRFNFSSLGGRFILLAFLGDSRNPLAQRFLAALTSANITRDDAQLVCFAVSPEARDQKDKAVLTAFPGQRVFLDPDHGIALSYGAAVLREDGPEFTGGWYLIDPMLRVYRQGGLDETEKLISAIIALPEAKDHAAKGQELWAPVLMVPRVLTPAFCAQLIALYREGTPSPSGFMREINGRTVAMRDANFKRRNDINIQNDGIRTALNTAIGQRLRPELRRAFQFDATRIERYIVARYGAEEAGFFRPHRDNTTAGTAHRRFAVSINLNAEDYEGGDLRFPEFGMRTYRPPTGGAVVFSCSLLHEATPVTKGERFATLPFLYDDAAAKVRAENRDKIDSEVLNIPSREGQALPS